MKCNLCPRRCNTERSYKTGYCGQKNQLKVARAALHYWEEPCISGEEGSGTVFFSGCGLRCVYCQNREIALGECGKEISVERLADIFLELQGKGANNINLVTGDHFVPEIVKAIDIAKVGGLKIPIVFNTSSYIEVSTLKMLKGYVDIYLPDFKYYEDETAVKYSNAKGYVNVAKKAIEEMVSQTGKEEYDDRGMMKSGVIIRHMILPGHTDESKKIIEYLYTQYGDRVVISIMNQYTPTVNVKEFPEIDKKVTEREYNSVINFAISIGVQNAFIQEGETADESFIPPFDLEGV